MKKNLGTDLEVTHSFLVNYIYQITRCTENVLLSLGTLLKTFAVE